MYLVDTEPIGNHEIVVKSKTKSNTHSRSSKRKRPSNLKRSFGDELNLRKTSHRPSTFNTEPKAVLFDIGSSNEEKQVLDGDGTSGNAGILHKSSKIKIPPQKNTFVRNLKTKINSFSNHRKYWVIAILIILVACLLWFLSQSWLVQSFLSQKITYPKVSVQGINVGNLDDSQLKNQLVKLKTEFETRKITLVGVKEKWVFDAKKIGVTYDIKATDQTIWRFNKLDLVDKYRLLTGSISPVVIPTISVDNNVCVKSLSVIPVVQVAPQNAVLYFDQGLKIKPDQTGSEFSAALTCRELSKHLLVNSLVVNISLKTISASLTKSNIESKFAQIQDIIGKTLSLKSGAYQLTQTPEQLFALLDISNMGSELQFSWSSRLDELINDIATKVNTDDSSPVLGPCQRLISAGGHRLDKVATKKIFTDLGATSPRDYNLAIVYYSPVIGGRTSVNTGSHGTVYLTFDDGMTYANQIMNEAACYGVKVTFFEIGERVGTDAAALRRAIAEGHAVQSHGHYHAIYDYGQRSYDWQYNDINQSIADIVSVTGVRPTYFRPPGGNRSTDTYTAANANGLKLILWGVSSSDATVGGLSSSQTCANVLARVFPGASVLMHSTHASTANAFPCIVEGLAARGYNMQALR